MDIPAQVTKHDLLQVDSSPNSIDVQLIILSYNSFCSSAKSVNQFCISESFSSEAIF
jgi:hypothetical protein